MLVPYYDALKSRVFVLWPGGLLVHTKHFKAIDNHNCLIPKGKLKTLRHGPPNLFSLRAPDQCGQMDIHNEQTNLQISSTLLTEIHQICWSGLAVEH